MIFRLICFSLLVSFVSAAEPPEGFVAIFNGKDLGGWEGGAEYWSVEDGALTGVTDGSLKHNRFITWKAGTVRNFELRAKVKITSGGNSGIQYRGTERPDLGEWVVTGYQCDVVPGNANYNGMLYEERGRRILAQTGQKVIIGTDGQPWAVGDLPRQEIPVDGWHDYRVVVEGNLHRHWIDGHPTVEVIDLDAQGRALEGVIAVQVHVGPAMKVQYKDFFLKTLPDDLPLQSPDKHTIPSAAQWVRPQRQLPKDWTPPVRGRRWVDLSAHLRLSKKIGSPKSEQLTSGGRTLEGIFLHASAPNQPASEIAFPPFKFPKTGNGITGIALRTGIGFKDGESFIEAKSDGCIFTVLANGEEIYRKDYATQEWLPESIDLTRFAGKDVALTLRVDPKKNSAADWASFAEPALWLTGDDAAMKGEMLKAAKFTSLWPLAELQSKRDAPNRTFLHTERTHIAVMDEHLDLATALDRLKIQPPVPLAPRIVVGEGAHPDNHTLVKILSPHGVTNVQFLAFPANVRGGVRVESFAGVIAATPLAQNRPAVIALFDRTGAPLKAIKPGVSAPFSLASVGDLLAVTSADEGGKCEVFNLDGKLIKSIPLAFGQTSLSSQNHKLLVYHEENRSLTMIDIESGESSTRQLAVLPPGRSVFATAFDDDLLWAGGPQAVVSHVYEIKPDGTHIGRDVGSEENQFWLGLPKEWEEEFGPFKGKDKAKHIHFSEYGHIRIDSLSPRYRDPEAAGWAGTPFLAALEQRGLTKPLNQQSLKMWNPTFTHRMFPGAFRPWAEQVDPVTGLNLWLQQSSTGGMDGYGNWDKPGFVSSTYAPGATAMQELYTQPLRAFARMWAPLYRDQPWLAPSIEPNHEFESVVATDGGVGDYNPHMIAGFYRWLERNYGGDVEVWEKRFGVPFDAYFDAPRDLARGEWDRYKTDNPYLQAWVEFNRYVINRTLALTYRETLAAGIPPEMIRCHQIPDDYAVAPVLQSGISRITPIDYAMTAGVGFGFTKFGVNYDKPENIIKAAKTSGFGSFVMGEFQPLSTDPTIVAKELRYVFNNGARAIHPLYWGAQHTGGASNPEDHQKNATVYAAIQELIDEDPPRPGQAGGIGQVRAFREGERAFNIVAIGDGGLLKSVRSDARMEGTVYVVPFHQHIRVQRLSLVENQIAIPGPIAPGSQIEVLGDAAAGAKIRVFRGDAELPDLSTSLSAQFRYTLRLPERSDNIRIKLEPKGELTIEQVTLQSPEAADIHTGRHEGIPHRGGVTFDTL